MTSTLGSPTSPSSRLDAREEMLLRWYVLDADAGAGGLPSSLGLHLERARERRLYDRAPPAPPDMERRLADSRCARSVRDRLRAMGRHAACVLVAAHCTDPPPGLAQLGRLGAVAPYTAAARAAYQRHTGATARPKPSTVARGARGRRAGGG